MSCIIPMFIVYLQWDELYNTNVYCLSTVE